MFCRTAELAFNQDSTSFKKTQSNIRISQKHHFYNYNYFFLFKQTGSFNLSIKQDLEYISFTINRINKRLNYELNPNLFQPMKKKARMEVFNHFGEWRGSNRITRCCFTIKGVWGYSNRPDVNRYKFGKAQTKTCLPSPNPSSSLKVKAVKTPEFPYMVIVTSMDKALTKCTHRTCDDQQDHTRWRWMYIMNMSHKHIK